MAVFTVGPYAGPLGDAVRAAKTAGAWGGWDGLAVGLGHAIAEHASATGTPAVDAVTWVPADRRRRRRRGRDHAEVLARAVAASLDVACDQLLLARPRRTDQAQLARDRRRDLSGEAFIAVGHTPPRVLLVDDVVATTATVARAAGALAASATESVVVAALCRGGRASR